MEHSFDLETLEPRLLLSVTWPTTPLNSIPVYVNQNGDATLSDLYMSYYGQRDDWGVFFDDNGPVRFQTGGMAATEMAFYNFFGNPTAIDSGHPAGGASIYTTIEQQVGYVVSIAGQNDATVGSYDLDINGPSAESTHIPIIDGFGSGGSDISAAFDYDFYHFTSASTPDDWTITVTPSGDLDVTFVIYDILGNPVAGSYCCPINSCEPEATETWSGTLCPYTSFYIRVDGYDDTTGDYTISIDRTAIGDYADTDDQISEAIDLGAIPVDGGKMKFEQVEAGADVDMYRFEVMAGQTLGFDVDALSEDSPLDSYLRLFSSSGTALQASDDSAGPAPEYTGLESYLEYSFNIDGTYYIAVSDYNNSSYHPVTGENDVKSFATWDYKLTVATVGYSDAEDRYEENDQLSDAADPLNNDGAWQQTWLSDIKGLGSQMDDDWYEINMPSGQKHLMVDLQFTHANGDINLAVFDRFGEPVAHSQSTSDHEAIDCVVVGPGAYYLKVYGDDSGNRYDLQWRSGVVLPGDANLDGEVGLIDLDILGRHWGQPGDWRQGDFNGSGVIDLLDLDILGFFYGFGSAMEAAPALPQNFHSASGDRPAFHSLADLGNEDEAVVLLF